jgi:hypothetical protein
MDLKGKRCECEGWFYLARRGIQWLALMNTVMNLRVPQGKQSKIARVLK